MPRVKDFSLQWNHQVSTVWCLQRPLEKLQGLWRVNFLCWIWILIEAEINLGLYSLYLLILTKGGSLCLIQDLHFPNSHTKLQIQNAHTQHSVRLDSTGQLVHISGSGRWLFQMIIYLAHKILLRISMNVSLCHSGCHLPQRYSATVCELRVWGPAHLYNISCVLSAMRKQRETCIIALPNRLRSSSAGFHWGNSVLLRACLHLTGLMASVISFFHRACWGSMILRDGCLYAWMYNVIAIEWLGFPQNVCGLFVVGETCSSPASTWEQW